ncbi:MAG TPA: MBL fold metallo-hydrolase [bacterium]
MKLSEHCHAALGFATVPPWTVNAGFVAGSERTLVVDTGPSFSAAQTLHGYATAVRPGNTILALNTEPHLDHIGGNSFFREKGIDIYGHPSIHRTNGDMRKEAEALNACVPDPIRRNFREGHLVFQGTAICDPNLSIQGNFSLDLGEIEARILLTPGHTAANVSVFVHAENVLFCGDTIVNRYQPNLECGDSEDWRAWLQSLNALRAMKPKAVLPGHGFPMLDEDEIEREIGRNRLVIEKAVREGRPS